MSLSNTERVAIIQSLIKEISQKKESFSASSFAKTHEITVQSVYRYISALVDDGKLTKEKRGRKNVFKLVSEYFHRSYPLIGLSEDAVFTKDIRPFLSDIPQIAFNNLAYAFTEMLNNAIDHSGGTTVDIFVEKNALEVTVQISDNGVGIFNKIADALCLPEKSFAILELAKGKFTTDPASHTGEGVFFSSKVVDEFAILSGDLVFLGPTSTMPPFIDKTRRNRTGTVVLFSIENEHEETSQAVFSRFTDVPESYGFTKTVVPVRLLEYGDEKPLVISRSQAKRLMVRFERFENILLDFSGIDSIGQGFADELFRVFSSQHPGTVLTPINCSDEVLGMINRVLQQRLSN